ncbi:MAG TPA: TonB family protein [Candidatus Tumulicola sp.]
MLKRAGRGQRILLIAFAISILLHLIFAVAYRMPRPRRSDDVETTVSIVRRSAIAVRTPQPLPSATPKPRPKTQPPAPKLKPGAKGFAPGSGGTAATPVPTALPQPTASVAAVPTAKPCGGNDIKAAVSEMPPQPDVPNAARAEGTDGTAAVDVRLDERGEVTAATVSHPTGNPSLDTIAVSLAKAARYTPATHDCRPVAGEYTFTVKFFAW